MNRCINYRRRVIQRPIRIVPLRWQFRDLFFVGGLGNFPNRFPAIFANIVVTQFAVYGGILHLKNVTAISGWARTLTNILVKKTIHPIPKGLHTTDSPIKK